MWGQGLGIRWAVGVGRSGVELFLTSREVKSRRGEASEERTSCRSPQHGT